MSICYFRAVVNPSTPIMENCLENFEKIGTFLIKNPKMPTQPTQILQVTPKIYLQKSIGLDELYAY